MDERYIQKSKFWPQPPFPPSSPDAFLPLAVAGTTWHNLFSGWAPLFYRMTLLYMAFYIKTTLITSLLFRNRRNITLLLFIYMIYILNYVYRNCTIIQSSINLGTNSTSLCTSINLSNNPQKKYLNYDWNGLSWFVVPPAPVLALALGHPKPEGSGGGHLAHGLWPMPRDRSW